MRACTSAVSENKLVCLPLRSLDALVAKEAESGSVFGREIAAVVKRGDQLPLNWVVRLFTEAMAADPTGYYALDGFPRTLEQARAVSEAIAFPATVLVLDVPEKVSVHRRGATAAAKGLRVFSGRTAAYIETAAATGIVRTVDADRPIGQVRHAERWLDCQLVSLL